MSRPERQDAVGQMTCWTGEDPETQPWIERTGHSLTLHVVIGVWTSFPCPTHDIVATAVARRQHPGEASIEESVRRAVIGLDRTFFTTPDAMAADEVVEAQITQLRKHHHLGDIRTRVTADGADDGREDTNKYLLASFPGVTEGELLEVEISVSTSTAAAGALVGVSLEADPLAVWITSPIFTADDLIGAATDDDDDGCWILLHQRDEHFDHLRLDLLDTSLLTGRHPDPKDHPSRPVKMTVDGTDIGLGLARSAQSASAAPGPVTSWVDRTTDSVLVTVPRRNAGNDSRPDVTIQPRSGPVRRVALDRDRPQIRPAALMIIAYAIQGINDLFAEPLRAPDGKPRGYADIIWQDEYALFSGKPEQPENKIPDGYRYMLAAQKRLQVPTVWAFNAGALLLLRSSFAGAAFDELRDAVSSGLVSPALAGFGAHRAAYYETETNVQEIRENAELIENLFKCKPNGIYFGDSRIYKASASEQETFNRTRDLVSYLVLERSTLAVADGEGRQRLAFPNPPTAAGAFNRIYRDKSTGLSVLINEDTLRDAVVNASPREVAVGLAPIDARRLLMRSVALDQEGSRRLFVVADDIEHFCGAGWFDGQGINFAAGYLAALTWVAHHPWIEVWTPDQVQPAPDAAARPIDHGKAFLQEFVNTATDLNITSSVDATIDPNGPEIGGGEQKAFYFDLWYDAWERFPASWLGCTLGEIAGQLEEALIAWPDRSQGCDAELYRLAWLYFLAGTHEGFWSKQPSRDRGPGHSSPFSWDPEDFVVSESIQLRNAWVYLNAAIWADRARTTDDASDYVWHRSDETGERGGWLVEPIRKAHGADCWWSSDPANGCADGLYWDHDNLPNALLYNRDVLAVIDENGGVITQLFYRVAGRAVSVSGTCKAYQFLSFEADRQRPCDGPRVQNTVLTPNHGYIGSDLRQALPWKGYFHDQRKAEPEPCWWPNNLDRYDSELLDESAAGVCLAYRESEILLPTEPISESEALEALEADGSDLRAGKPGIIWHRDKAFEKTISLTGSTINITYHNVQPDHLVANEFTVDLLAQLMGSTAQDPPVRSERSAQIAGSGVTVTVEAGAGAMLIVDVAHSPAEHLVRRVMTDTIVVGPQPRHTSFSYTIRLGAEV